MRLFGPRQSGRDDALQRSAARRNVVEQVGVSVLSAAISLLATTSRAAP
jgi:hypothetical protein